MAVTACSVRMLAFKWEFRITSVIEARVMPVSGIVTALALLAAATVVCIVRLMASEAIGWRVRERSVLVTIQACGFPVLAKQRKFCGVVVKLCVFPFGRLVTRRAVVIHRIFVRFVVAVTIDAVRQRFPMFLIVGMTVAAPGFEVCTGDIEVSEGVVEFVFDQNNDVGIAAVVIRMAGRALVVAGLRMESVIADGRINICGNVLVTIHTELSLR